MSTPETYEFIPDDNHLRAQQTIELEYSAANSAVEYMNYLQHLYSQPSLETYRGDENDETLFCGRNNITEVHQLASVARFIHRSSTPELNEETDSFFRGSLLATHQIHQATENTQPGRDAVLFIRKRIIRSAPWIKVENSIEDLGDVSAPIQEHVIMPAKDATEQDETALSDDLLVRHHRIASSLISRLFPYDAQPVIPERYEMTAQKIAGELSVISQQYSKGFLDGFRFMMQLYTNPDEHHRIVDLWDEYGGFKHIVDKSAERELLSSMAAELGDFPESQYESLTQTRAYIINELRRLAAKGPAIDADNLEAYRAALSNTLTEFAAKNDLLTKGDLVQITGNYFAVFESTGTDNDVTVGHVIEDEDSEILGTYDGIDIIEAPTNKTFKKYLEHDDSSLLVPEQFVPALRIKEPEFFDTDSKGNRRRISRDREFVYRIPLTYNDTSMGRHLFPH